VLGPKTENDPHKPPNPRLPRRIGLSGHRDGADRANKHSAGNERRLLRACEGRDDRWTSEMPNLGRTARKRRTPSAAHDRNHPERCASLRHALPALRSVASFRSRNGERDDVPHACLAAKGGAPGGRRRARTVRQRVRVLLAARDQSLLVGVGFDPCRTLSGPE
jgi:hypothetical protein